jgi:FAD synthetase
MRRALAFGTFDLLHPGHEHFLREARSHGDHLTVIVARDETVRAVKGRPPAQDERERLAAVRALPFVDDARLGELGDKMRVVRDARPDVICLGYDQRAFTDELTTAFPDIPVMRLAPYEPERYKSSKMKRA